MRIAGCLALLAFGAAVWTGVPGQALAFDFFGLFGSDDPPPVSAVTLPYRVEFAITGADDDAIERNLQDASHLYALRQDPPPDAESLVRRAQADFPALVDALWGAGYYDAQLRIVVAEVPVAIGSEGQTAAIRAAQSYRARAVVPVKVAVETGPLFTLREVRFVRLGRGQAEEAVPERVTKLSPGDPARAADLRSAQARAVDYLRAQGHPFAKIVATRPVVDHATGTMDVVFTLEAGPKAGFGAATVTGTENLDPAVVRSYLYIEPGDPYSPQALADARKSIGRIQALGSVRIREAGALDQWGNLPIFVEVTERKPRLVGFSAHYSTVDGPAVRGYWEHRNLFGGGETLRLQADAFVAPRTDGTRIKRFKDLEASDIGARLTASFVKPALWGTRTDLLFDAMVERDRTGGDRFGGYSDRLANVQTALRYRFSDTFSVQGGLEYERGVAEDVLGKVDYTLVGTPVALRYDSTDKPLDPSRGFRLTATVAPYTGFLGSSLDMVQARATGSVYYALDEDARYILAARLGLGSILGPELEEIPANRRFYAGGGGSVRGYRYRSLAPQVAPSGFVIGGRSLLEGSIEARIKVTDTIGIVPFLDAGGAFASEFPDFKDEIRASAGIGLRYYTAIGPIRFDVATPLNPRRGDKPVVLYVSIGQAF